MKKNILSREARGEEGVTLVEIMMVVAIIIIVLGYGIPRLLQARENAMDTSARNSLRIAYANAETLATVDNDFGVVTTDELQASEPTLIFQAAASDDDKTVTVETSPAGTAGQESYIMLSAKSESGRCFTLVAPRTEVAAPPVGNSGTGMVMYGSSEKTSANCDSGVPDEWETEW